MDNSLIFATFAIEIKERAMTENEILELRDPAEAGKVQFKERIYKNDKYNIGREMAAFSNPRGGRLIVGINDKPGNFNGLSYLELQETTNLLTNIAYINSLKQES